MCVVMYRSAHCLSRSRNREKKPSAAGEQHAQEKGDHFAYNGDDDHFEKMKVCLVYFIFMMYPRDSTHVP